MGEVKENNSENPGQVENPGQSENLGQSRILRIEYRTHAALLLAAANVLYFIFLLVRAGADPDNGTLISYGAMYDPLITGQHEYYRFFTCCFLHFGITHLVNNMVNLCAVGSYLELYAGGVCTTAVYIISGIAGNVFSFALRQAQLYIQSYAQLPVQHAGLRQLLEMLLPAQFKLQAELQAQGVYVISGGASGACFGLLGALIVTAAANHGQLGRIKLKNLIFMFVMSTALGLADQNVDAAAHFGGFAAGALTMAAIILSVKCLSGHGETSKKGSEDKEGIKDSKDNEDTSEEVKDQR